MQILLFRHGVAEEREAFAAAGRPDSERPLTAKGRERTREAASGLARLVPELGLVATSPYVRARQTAEILAAAFGDPGLETVDELQPGGRPARVCGWLEALEAPGTVALVGHEPDLSGLMAWFTTGQKYGYARFKKAGACLIEFESRPARGVGELWWLLPPSVLRCLGAEQESESA